VMRMFEKMSMKKSAMANMARRRTMRISAREISSRRVTPSNAPC